MLNSPLVSICLPTYNNGNFIKETIYSLINQTYKNIDIIVCDNASEDNTMNIVNTISDKRIRYVRGETRVSAPANFNRAIKLSKADYLTIYHSDDVYEPEIVEKELNFITSHNLGAVFTLDQIIDENGRVISKGIDIPKRLRNKSIFNYRELLDAILYEYCSFIVCPTFMCNKRIFEKTGYFDESSNMQGSASDTDMWIRIARYFNIGIISERLIKRRVSRFQGTSAYNSSRVVRADHFAVIDRYFNDNLKLNNDSLNQYDFNKLCDDIIVSKNLISLERHSDAIHILESSISLKRLMTGLKNIHNTSQLFKYFCLLLLLYLGLAKIALRIYRAIKRKLWA